MPLIIVNADDLGASEPVNDAIFDLMESNLVTSTTLIANAPAFEHAVKRVTSFPACSVGVHLNLTVFRPLSSSHDLDPVLNENGELSQRLFQASLTIRLLKALHEELALQVKRVRVAGVPITHFDSHQQVHVIPNLFPVLKALQRQFGITKVRPAINLLPQGHRAGFARPLAKRIYMFALRNAYRTRSPQLFGAFCDFHAALTARGWPPFRDMELMVHPGTTNRGYNDEVALLRSE